MPLPSSTPLPARAMADELEDTVYLSYKKRSKRGKGRKERLKHKLESLKAEREEFQRESLKLARKNTELKRFVNLELIGHI